MKENSKQNFGLSQDTFDQMISELQGGDETLFKHIFLKHFRECMTYLIKKCSISRDEAYDLTMDTLLMFRAKCLIGKIKYGNLRFLFTQMAYQRFLKQRRGPSESEKQTEFSRTQNSLEDPREVEMIHMEEMQAIDQVWDKLGAGCRRILVAFYYENSSSADVAEMLQKKPAAVRKQKQRCINHLRLLFQKKFQS